LRNNSRVIVLGARESAFPIDLALMPCIFIPMMTPRSSELRWP